MKTKSTWLAMLCSIALVSPGLLTTAGEVKAASADWWDIPYPEPLDASKIETTLQFIHVEGNRFVDEDDNPRTFHGVNIAEAKHAAEPADRLLGS